MASRFVIMEKETGAPTRAPRVVIVRDGWSLVAFLFPFFWSLWNRLPLVALLVFTAMLVLGVIATDPRMVVPAYVSMILFSSWIGLENGQWRIAGLTRKGYMVTGAVTADTLEEAELHWAERAENQNAVADDVAMARNHLIEYPLPRRKTSDDMIFVTSSGKR